MADYHAPVVVQPSVPNACITALERWILDRMFEREPDDRDRTYFFASGCIEACIELDPELERALNDDKSPLAAMRDAITVAKDNRDWLDLDRIGGPAAVFQSIIARHPDEGPFVTLEMAYTCSKMRPDGFGGRAELITADEVRWVSTSVWLENEIGELGRCKAASAQP